MIDVRELLVSQGDRKLLVEFKELKVFKRIKFIEI
jgi:hypothetical protein